VSQVDAILAGAGDVGEQLGQPVGQRLAPGDVALGGLALELPDDLGRRAGADVGVDQRLLQPFPRLVAQVLEQRGLDLGGQRLPSLAQVLAQPAEHAAPALLGLRCRFRGPGRRGAVDDKQIAPIASHGYAAAGNRREITLEIPSAPIDTP
jgi:hypothetical protein